ncbi:MAG TPA: PHP domain-containing protein [Bacteroidales bacterium]|nr:PHP domain-containing protein [Bacteroidales bacterium]HPZ60665.1 PHP domain-containing protein [Bacteroidales bacterium]HQD58165.1 PHP domain-containing protein [Bacteroidales bacterium]
MMMCDLLYDFIADLHIHTVLSPCGSLDMSPINIVKEASKKGIDIIGITDHNASANCKVTFDIAKDYGIFTLCGLEVTTKEETHCLTFFQDFETLDLFQKFIDDNIIKIDNDPDKFGYQLIVDKDENIVDQIDWLLINATNISIDDLEKKVHQLNGLFIPAHIDRSAYSLISQLGIVPKDLNVDAFEVSKYSNPQNIINSFPYTKKNTFISDSDAHFINDIGCITTIFHIKNRSFHEIKKSLYKIDGRDVCINYNDNI